MLDTAAKSNDDNINEALADYSRSLHEYTLRLWTESRRKVEQQAQARAKSQRTSMKNSEKRSKGSTVIELVDSTIAVGVRL